MNIRYAILGLLNWKPFSGYDLKARFENSTLFYWSGNNNQIYRTLVELHNAGLVAQQIQYQESLPAKKIYSITEKGRAELRDWTLSNPELPEFRNTFLIQLAWADLLSDEELDALLERYEKELAERLLMEQESARRTSVPQRTAREAFLWNKIQENQVAAYQRELEWARQIRLELQDKEYENTLKI